MQTSESPLSKLEGIDFILPGNAQAIYGKDTVSTSTRIAGAAVVRDRAAIPEILRVANEHRLKLWPISRGRNFGYGSAVPAANGCIVVDLSALREITWNARSSAVTVEPGVTLAELHKFLASNKLDYLVPVTGAGGQGSVLGNALDGGFNLTPLGDHFDALTHAEGFWGSGAPFTSLLDQLGCENSSLGWKHGLGPSALSLLRQGRYGLVTKGTFRLRTRPEACGLLELRWPTAEAFLKSQHELSRILDDAPAIAGFTAVQAPLPDSDAPPPAGPDSPWLCVAPVFGSKESVTCAGYTAERRLRGIAKVTLFSVADLKRMHSWRATSPWILKALSAIPGTGISKNSGELGGFVPLLEGTPHFDPLLETILPASTFNKLCSSSVADNPDTGLLWYSALLPATELSTTKFVDMARKVLLRNGQSAALMLTMVDSRTVVARVPLVFDKSDSINAKECIKDLTASGLKLEIPPQRVSAEGWGKLLGTGPRHPQWATLQNALDPNMVLWPNRGAG